VLAYHRRPRAATQHPRDRDHGDLMIHIHPV
jgi:hypothetical protein